VCRILNGRSGGTLEHLRNRHLVYMQVHVVLKHTSENLEQPAVFSVGLVVGTSYLGHISARKAISDNCHWPPTAHADSKTSPVVRSTLQTG